MVQVRAPDGTALSPDVLMFNWGLHNSLAGNCTAPCDPGQSGPPAEYAPCEYRAPPPPTHPHTRCGAKPGCAGRQRDRTWLPCLCHKSDIPLSPGR
jgi:hypothetical protein